MESNSSSCLFPNTRFNLDVLQQLENDLLLEEKIALVFLLYDDVPVAQERLYLTYKASKENTSCQLLQMNLLHDWALRSGPFWREKLVEGLLILKSFSNLKKLDLDLDLLIKHFLPYCLQTSLFIHPMKKILYSVCESFDSKDTKSVVSTVLRDCPSIKLETLDFEYLEYFLLKLFRHQYIQLGAFNVQSYLTIRSDSAVASNIQKFVAILKSLNFTEHCDDLLAMQEFLNKYPNDIKPLVTLSDASFPDIGHLSIKNPTIPKQKIIQDNPQHAMPTANFQLQRHSLQQNNMKGSTSSVQPSTSLLDDNHGHYTIQNSTPIGLFVIINQVVFKNEKNPDLIADLGERVGSDEDVKRLTKSWISLGFKVVVFTNLNYHDTLLKIRLAATTMVSPEHSVFALCFLTHGAKGSVFAADGVGIKIEKIEQMLYVSEAPELAGKPKIIFIQACQGQDKLSLLKHYEPQHDGPQPSASLTSPDKSDMFVHCSTVPNFASYRDPDKGTWFIQCLCNHLDQQKGDFDFVKLCILVNGEVGRKTFGKFGQMPEFTTCFTKSLYLRKK